MDARLRRLLTLREAERRRAAEALMAARGAAQTVVNSVADAARHAAERERGRAEVSLSL